MPAQLPADLSAALDALEANAALRAAVGENFCDQFLQVKRAELAVVASSSVQA